MWTYEVCVVVLYHFTPYFSYPCPTEVMHSYAAVQVYCYTAIPVDGTMDATVLRIQKAPMQRPRGLQVRCSCGGPCNVASFLKHTPRRHPKNDGKERYTLRSIARQDEAAQGMELRERESTNM